MQRLFQPLLFFVARCSRNELIRQLEFLKAENQMLRKDCPFVISGSLTPSECGLFKLGQAIGPGLHKLISIVATARIRRGFEN